MARSDVRFAIVLLLLGGIVSPWVPTTFAQENEEEMTFWLGVAKRYMTEGNFEQAASSYRRVLQTLPDHPDALAGLAAATEKLRDKGEAFSSADPSAQIEATPILETEEDLFAAYRRALTEDERQKVALRLGEFHLRKAQDFERDGKRAQAMLHFRKARVLAPNNPLAHYQIFKAFVARKRMQEAIEAANRFLALQGYGALAAEVRRQLLEVHLSVGDRCVKRSRWEDAAEHFRRVLDLDPRSRQAAQAVTKLALVHYTLASTFHAKGRYVDAARQVEGLYELKNLGKDVSEEIETEYGRKVKRFAVGACWRAAKEQEAKDPREALKFYRRVHELSPWSNFGKGAKQTIARLENELNVADTIGAKKLYEEAAAQELPPVPQPTDRPVMSPAPAFDRLPPVRMIPQEAPIPPVPSGFTAPQGSTVPGTDTPGSFTPGPSDNGLPDVVEGVDEEDEENLP